MKEKLVVLGNGHAHVTQCYNACYLLISGGDTLLIDAGGGNEILKQLQQSNVDIGKINDIFISHVHTDHILGAIWMIRIIAAKILAKEYDGKLNLYCNEVVADSINKICYLVLQRNFTDLIGTKIIINKLKDKDVLFIKDWRVQFFDIRSKSTLQYGCQIVLKSGKKLCFLGDEPFRKHEMEFAKNCDWLLHEALCLEKNRNLFRPDESNHSSVKDACNNANKCQAKSLIMIHCDDTNLKDRKKEFSQEASKYINIPIFIPNDLDEITL